MTSVFWEWLKNWTDNLPDRYCTLYLEARKRIKIP